MATLTEIMERVVDEGTGEAGAGCRLYRRGQDRNRQEAGERQLPRPLGLQRLVCRLRALAQAGLHHRGRRRFTSPGRRRTAVSSPRRSSRRSRLRHSGSTASAVNQCAGAGARRSRRDEDRSARDFRTGQPPPLVQLTVEYARLAGSGLDGLSAREASARWRGLGCTAQLRGAGLVVDQWPAPGTPLDSGVTVVLTLDVSPSSVWGVPKRHDGRQLLRALSRMCRSTSGSSRRDRPHCSRPAQG